MSNEKALLDCTFGWGKTCRLYQDFMEIAGKFYSLNDLVSVHPTYRKMFGVSSARLELCFGSDRLVLRGISNIEVVRKMVSHLLPYCSEQPFADVATHRMRSRTSQARDLARAQARAWERTNNPAPSSWDAIPLSPVTSNSDDSDDEAFASMTVESFDDERTSEGDEAFFEDELLAEELIQEARTMSQQAALASFPDEILTNPALETVQPVEAELVRRIKKIREEEEDTLLAERERAPSSIQTPTGVPASPPVTPIGERVSSQSMRMFALHTRVPRLQPPIRSVRLVQSERRSPLANAPIETTVKTCALPIIHVPVRLQPGECAHYSTGAALYSDQQSATLHNPSTPLERGLLILTNRRIFYIGKRSQFILAYTQLWYVSRSSSTIAIHIERQFRQVIIEVEHPDEWVSRIERLAFLARRVRPKSAYPRLSAAALPGLKPVKENALTLKRAAAAIEAQKAVSEDGTTLKRAVATVGEQTVATANSSTQKRPMLTPAAIESQKTGSPSITRALSPRARANQRIVEAKTVSLGSHRSHRYSRNRTNLATRRPVRHLVDLKTIDLSDQADQSVSEKKTVEFYNPEMAEKTGVVNVIEREPDEKKIEIVKTSTPDGRRRVEEAEVETVLLSQLRDQDYEEVETLLLRRPEEDYEEVETVSLRQHNYEEIETRSLRELEDGAMTTTHLRGRRKVDARTMARHPQGQGRERSEAGERKTRRASRARSLGQS